MAEPARVKTLSEHDTFAFPRWNEARAAELASPPRWAPGRGIAAPVSSATAEPLVLPAPAAPASVALFDQHDAVLSDDEDLTDDEPTDFFEPARAPVYELEAAGEDEDAAPAPRQIRGRPGEPRGLGRVIELDRRRPARRPQERVGSRPDRIALWALFMGVLLALVAATSSNAAPL